MMLTVLRFIPWDNQKAWIGSGAWRMIHPLFDVLRIRTSLYPLGLYSGIPDEPLAPMGDLPTPRVGDEASVTCWSLRRWGSIGNQLFFNIGTDRPRCHVEAVHFSELFGDRMGFSLLP